MLGKVYIKGLKKPPSTKVVSAKTHRMAPNLLGRLPIRTGGKKEGKGAVLPQS